MGWSLTGSRGGVGHPLSLTGPIAVGAPWTYTDSLDRDEASCDGVPLVHLRVQDTEGRWYRWTSGTDCSPCGPLGSINVDVSEDDPAFAQAVAHAMGGLTATRADEDTLDGLAAVSRSARAENAADGWAAVLAALLLDPWFVTD